MEKVAVSGMLASGKSQVCQLLRSKGAYVVSSDGIVHHLYSLPHILASIIQICGQEVIKEGKVERSKVAHCVFNDKTKLKALEQLLHPLVFEEIKKEYDKAKQLDSPLFVVEAPLVFEAHWESFFDQIISIDTDPQLAKQRYVASGHTEDDFKARTRRQLDRIERNKRAHIVIPNNGTIEELNQLVNQLIK